MKAEISIAVNEDTRYYIGVRAVPMGSDLVVLVEGGTKPHTGAVAIYQYPVGEDSEISVCLPGHRDDVVANKYRSVLADVWDGSVIVIAGIHVDQASPEDIRLLLSASDHCLELLTEKLMSLRHAES